MSAQGESSYATYNQNATINSVGTAEYLIDGASSYEAIWAQPKPASDDLHLVSYEKREGVAYVSVENDGGEAAISLPIYNYGNYYAADESGAPFAITSGENMRIYIASGDFLTRNTERRVEVGVRVDDREIAKKLRGILDLQLRDTVNAREMQPDGTYVKVHPAEGQPPVDSQMAMFGYFQNGFVQETDKPDKPKAESKPKAAAVKAAVKPVPRQRAALRPKRAGLLQSLFGRGKK